MFKEFLCLKTKQNSKMSDEEHSDSEFYYPEEMRSLGGMPELHKTHKMCSLLDALRVIESMCIFHFRSACINHPKHPIAVTVF